MTYYSPMAYYTPNWIYPRSRFRENFPRFRKRFNPNLLVPGGAQSIPVTHPNLYWSPYNTWSDGSGTLQANNTLPNSTKTIWRDCGAYLKFSVISGGAGVYTLNLDTTSLQTVNPAALPYIYITVDGLPYVLQQLTYQAGTFTVALGNNMSAGIHVFRIVYARNLAGSADAWNTPLQCVTIKGLTIDGGSSMTTQFIRPNLAIFYGDSELAGYAAPFDASTSWAENSAWALKAEYGIISAPGLGYQFAGLNNVPQFWNSPSTSIYQYYFGTQSRLVGGLFSPSPNYVLVALGTNDGFHLVNTANVQNSITPTFNALRAAAPNAWLAACIPPYQWYAGYITAGFNNYLTTSSDPRATILDAGTEIVTYFDSANPGGQGLMGDSSHPNQRGHAVLGTEYMAQYLAFINKSTSSSSVIIQPTKRIPYRVSSVVYNYRPRHLPKSPVIVIRAVKRLPFPTPVYIRFKGQVIVQNGSQVVILPTKRIPYRIPVYIPVKRSTGNLFVSLVQNTILIKSDRKVR